MFVAKVAYRDAVSFYSAHHYLGGVSLSSSSWGLYELEGGSYNLTACCSFGAPVSENLRASIFGDEHKDRVKELQRLARSSTCSHPMSAFVARAIHHYIQERAEKSQPELWALVSFADNNQGHHGGIYQAMSWLYCGSVTATIDIFKDESGRARHRRQDGQNISRAKAQELGWSHERIKSTKHRYLKLLGSGRKVKRLKLKLRLQTLSYPKPQRSNAVSQEAAHPIHTHD